VFKPQRVSVSHSGKSSVSLREVQCRDTKVTAVKSQRDCHHSESIGTVVEFWLLLDWPSLVFRDKRDKGSETEKRKR